MSVNFYMQRKGNTYDVPDRILEPTGAPAKAKDSQVAEEIGGRLEQVGHELVFRHCAQNGREEVLERLGTLTSARTYYSAQFQMRKLTDQPEVQRHKEPGEPVLGGQLGTCDQAQVLVVFVITTGREDETVLRHLGFLVSEPGGVVGCRKSATLLIRLPVVKGVKLTPVRQDKAGCDCNSNG